MSSLRARKKEKGVDACSPRPSGPNSATDRDYARRYRRTSLSQKLISYAPTGKLESTERGANEKYGDKNALCTYLILLFFFCVEPIAFCLSK